MRTRRGLLIALCFSFSAFARQPSARQKVRFDGVGSLRIGMEETTLRKLLGPAFRLETRDSGVYASWGDPHLGLVLIEGKLARIDIAGGRWRTINGARVGSLESEIRELFQKRQLETRPHSFDPRGHILLLRSKSFAVAFETDGDIVTAIRVGLLTAVVAN